LLAIGDGKVPTDDYTTAVIQLPETMGTFVFNVDELVSRVYPDLLSNYTNITWLSEHYILAPLSKTTCTINATLVEQLSGECVQYKSLDSVPDESQAVEFPTEFFKHWGCPHICFIEGWCTIYNFTLFGPPTSHQWY